MLAQIFSIIQDDWLLLLIGQYPNGPLGGIAATLLLSVLGIALAFPLSVVVALARLSPWLMLRAPATALVYIMRGVPLLMIIFWGYFLVPLVIGTVVPGFVTMVVALVIYEAAFLSEIVRAGIQALPRGQMDAARALGHSHIGAMRYVILPQAIYNMTPSLLSQFVSTIKETTLGYVINVPELTFAANQINNRLLTKPFEVFALLAAIYFVVCWSLTQLANWLERRVAAKRAGKGGAHAPVNNGTPLAAEP
ncbi:amino acid ABC transporter permease [Bradyrhizobium sp. SSBR45G]|uniref:amino acid ABC transporter permease n=1 Tax=unclassified Bradyrhizobium TaxID=2631580 RepID=UPI002342B519|nr:MULTISPECIES: amino acid ABC transporter permease [unclassified Bradyrhizobium]GLH76084.1 amino acid ABC transporter permease [Bradyrhizobium sp. SSBR45G]GLH83432.1 amino acid ABC transporter permease [Bradyrhizobium sp. SSBR45R]